MTEPAPPRAALKRACLDRLDAVAHEHPACHQGKLAARYMLHASGGDRISLMFEKHHSTPAALPIVGPATVPVLQLALVTAMADAYDLAWDRDRLIAFLSALGTGTLSGALIAIAGRSLAGLIPVVGQTAVPVLTAGYGFASTYAVGRAAAYWMYYSKAGGRIDDQALRDRYLAAFSKAKVEDGNRAAV